jgi:Flp pilus assembly protein protease CpaA
MATGGHTSGDAVAGVTISFTIVAAFCTIMRLYTRFVLNKMGGVDDIFIAIATVCFPSQHLRLFPLTRDIGSGSSPNDYHVCTRFV